MLTFNLHRLPRSPGSYRRWVHIRMLILLLAIAIAPTGCSKEEIKQRFDEAKAKTRAMTESAVEAVEERLPETGSIALQTNPPVEIKKADIELISIGDGRPNVVQIITYNPSTTTRTYPSVLLHGTTTANSAAALAGETVMCDMYYQASATAPAAMTKPGGYVSVEFGALNAEDNALPATLREAELVGSDDKPVQIRGGAIVAVIRGEGN
jgi:hypothetical protein